ncbi:MAG: PilZ domain-containing protein [Desulfobacterales bacterium]|nr:PilZ domain-containing protein [Desulfobacterales bacterium]
MTIKTSGNPPPSGERRTTPRFGVELWAEETAGRGLYFHRITNLSLGGFFIEKKIPFPVGQKVDLQLELPGSVQKTPVTGRIINNYQDQYDNLRGAGIQFVALDEQARAGITAYLKRVVRAKALH